MSSSPFVHLHVHTEYSMLDGMIKIPDLVSHVKKLGQPAVAMTDHGGMYGTIEFYNECKKQGIHPIIGVETYLAKVSRFDKQLKMGSDQFHLLLLAETTQGYQNLMHLISLANLEGFSYKPRIDEEILQKYSEGLLCTSGCMSSLFNRLLRDGQDDEALAKFKQYAEWFPGRFYVELQQHVGVKSELEEQNRKLISIARQLGLPLLATNDVHYLNAEDARAQDALLCVQQRKVLSDPKRLSMLNSPDHYLKSSQEMQQLFQEYPEALANTLKIAERCQVEIPIGQLIFPQFPIPKNHTTDTYLKELSESGLQKKFDQVTPELQERLRYELEVISSKGYSTYFLITQDFVNWAKDQGIGVGPGRGSAAGSLVAFALNITTMNPLQHGLPFERFLNPQRPTPPDIDMDFADDRRDDVIAYVSEKYGADRVAQVITFGRMEARVAIRDMGRVLALDYSEPDRIAKLIPNEPGRKVSLDSAVRTVPELAEYYKQPKYKELVDLAKKVEGVVRHNSVHAAAVVIADKPLWEYTPIQKDTKSGKMVTQYDMYSLDCNVSSDAIGLLKFDFLGLRNLSTLQTAVTLIKQTTGQEIDLGTLPLDDAKTFQLLSSGETTGVFQLESAGMRRVARSLQPSQFSDIAAMVALFRPGPMDLIPKFIEGKHNPEAVVYPHPTLKQVLGETYGVMVYQEQILQIANVMAGYSLSEADILRKAIGKKDKKLLDKNKARFIEQSIEHKYTSQVAEQVWKFIEAFANYGFNKAHAASYAMIAYQTAYLKANFPVEYMAALMSVESDSHSANRDQKVAVAIEASKKMGISILPPDMNASQQDFTLEKNEKSLNGYAIRFGFTAIKNVGVAAIDHILDVRKKVGKFTSFTHFLVEVDGQKVNKKVLESLIKVGCMDSFGTRASMLEQLEKIREKAKQFDAKTHDQEHLFAGVQEQPDVIIDQFSQLPEYPKAELLSFEKALLGIYLTEHPLGQALEQVAKRATKQINELDISVHRNATFLFGGIITKWRTVSTKKDNKLMGFGTLEDQTGSIDFVAFPSIYEANQAQLAPDHVVLLKAKVDEREEEMQLVIEKVMTPDEVHAANVYDSAEEIFIPRNTPKETLQALGTLLKAHPGSSSVMILIPNGGEPKKLILPYTVKWDEELEKEVAKVVSG